MTGDLFMGGKDILNIGVLQGYSTNDLTFYDYNAGTKTLSELATSGSTYWEVISSALVPVGYDTIQGRDTYDLYIKPASGKILYLG